jgi:hypothetical protein
MVIAPDMLLRNMGGHPSGIRPYGGMCTDQPGIV